MKQVQVAVGVIEYDQKIFIARRRADQHQGDRWEFPGGKMEQDESCDAALIRELSEETGIQVESSQISMLTDIAFTYPEKSVLLYVRWVNLTQHQALAIHGAENQITRWVPWNQLSELRFPDANIKIITNIERHFTDLLADSDR